MGRVDILTQPNIELEYSVQLGSVVRSSGRSEMRRNVLGMLALVRARDALQRTRMYTLLRDRGQNSWHCSRNYPRPDHGEIIQRCDMESSTTSKF